MQIVVFSGGSASNALLDCFLTLAKGGQICYVLPVSDNGGSSSEIQRVVGGIAIGDFRNRCLHLFRNEPLRLFLHYRLANDAVIARNEWYQLLNGEHVNWGEIDSEQESRLVHDSLSVFNQSILDACYSMETSFDFSSASVGNLVLKGLELQYGLELALQKFVRLGRCPENVIVVPCIETEERVNLCLGLTDGSVIRGQSEISHPSTTGSQLHFCKDGKHEALTAAIGSLWYEDRDGKTEEFSAPGLAVDAILKADLVVYSIGSLVTSILPSLIVKDIANALGKNVRAAKTVLVNGSYDRESSGLTCSKYLELIENTVKKNYDGDDDNVQFVTDLIRLEGGEILCDDKLNKRVREHVVTGGNVYECPLLYEALLNVCEKNLVTA